MEHVLTIEAIKFVVMVVVGFAAGWYAHIKRTQPDKIKNLTSFIDGIDKAVQGAQQLWWAKTGADRKRVVTDTLKKLRDRYNVDLTDDELELFIEAGVYILNQKAGVGYLDTEEETEGPF